MAIQPLADALNSIMPTLESLDQRLKVIESVLPRNEKNQLRTLAPRADVVSVYKKLESLSQQSVWQKLVGQPKNGT